MSGKFFPSLFLFFSVSSAFAAPELVSVPIDRTFFPVGFDDNDISQVVITGDLPDTCHKLGPTGVHVDRVNKVLTVQQRAYKAPGVCMRVFVPYTSVVNVGILEAGTYTVEDRASGKIMGPLTVEVAKTPWQDDYLYAPVADAFVETQGGKRTLVITGSFTDRCTSLKEVRVEPHKDVIVVQPIAGHTDRPHNCGHEKVPFLRRDALPQVAGGTYLLHVRSMNGQALNKVIELP